MCEIFLAESPANVFSEAMGRLTNMIQGNLKTRMGDSLVDALIRTYKNSGHLQFWESHLDNLYHCHRNLMQCSSNVPIWPPRHKSNSNSCAKVYNFDPTPPSTRFSSKAEQRGFSHQRYRRKNSHKRQLVLKNFFDDEFDICDLQPNNEIESQKPPKKRKLQARKPSKKKRKWTRISLKSLKVRVTTSLIINCLF